MAAIVRTLNSVELTQVPPIGTTYSPLKPSQWHGRVRVASFSYAFAGTEVKDTTILGLCNLPKNARVLQATVITDATTSTSTFQIGLIGRDGSGLIDATTGATVADNATWWGTVGAVAGAQTAVVANTAAQHALYTLVRDCIAILTVKTTDIGAPFGLSGYFLYVVD